MTLSTVLPEKFRKKEAVIGVIGLGYVGLPLSLRFSQVGYKVIGFDKDPEKVRRLQAAQSYIERIGSDQISAALAAGFEPVSEFSRAADCDAWLICVPTPLTKQREPDLSLVQAAMRQLQPYLHKNLLISLESTTWPGTTEEEIYPLVSEGGLEPGTDLALVYSPEREDPGNDHFSTGTIPKVVGGMTPACLEAGVALYQGAVDQVVPVSSLRTAEMTKLLENIHRSVNIGLVNEMKLVADKMGIDIHEVIRAASTKPFGFTPYYPGPGLGGHCIPVDPFYLTWKAREYGVHTRFIELAGEVNQSMPAFVADKVVEALNSVSKSVKGSRILLLGLAYKKNIDDLRESPALIVAEKLLNSGALLSYTDPHIPFARIKEGPSAVRYESTPLDKNLLTSSDCVVLITDHDRFDYDLIRNYSPLLVDTRGVWQGQDAHLFRA
ncbi:MAG: nucleotide sugar dehydrogenase [Deltaproteobacteria bacterium]|nr:nucleotide sugar dehydrogenase [Deltaproteobacteria bacterium]